jgi:hypothetical protein
VGAATGSGSPYYRRMSSGRRVCQEFALVSLVGLTALSLSAVAQADRPATTTERAGIAATLQVPVECVGARVSTVDPLWAIFMGRRFGSCPEGDGFIGLVRLPDGSFDVVTQGSFERSACTIWRGPMPAPVARDFDLCRAPRAYLLCRAPGKRYRNLRERPRRCDTLGPDQALAFGINMANVRWRNWGRPRAGGRGIVRGYRLPPARVPVRIIAYRPRPVCGGDQLYTRLRVFTRYTPARGLVYRFPARCGD